MADNSQKTEKPTQRRLTKARKDGNFPSGRLMVSAAQFLLFIALLGSGGERWFSDFRLSTHEILIQAFAAEMTPAQLAQLCVRHAWKAFSPLITLGAILLMGTLAVQLAVTKFGVSLSKLAPDLKRVNPMAKIRQLPEQNIPALIQASVMIPFFGAAVYYIARDHMPAYAAIPLKSVLTGAMQVVGSLQELLWKAAMVFVVFGAIDLFRQRSRYQREMKMSKQEIRDEVKEMEGNLQMKMRIRRIRRDLLRRRMMQEVAKATALVVNPTHYAVAIRYEMNSQSAPVVVAKGKNYLALRIRKRALEHDVPLVENPPLAQALYKSVDVGQEIPAHFYRAVAEILAYIYRLTKGRLTA